MKVLVLGDGLLGSEIVRQTGWDFVSRKKGGFNINDIKSYNSFFSGYNTIVNCIANTNTYSNDKESHWNVNYVFVDNLVNYCNDNNIKLVHISTDYIYTYSIENSSETDVPCHLPTWYGYTKLLGDAHVQLKCKNYLVCRLSHKPYPFPYDKAWTNIKTNGDYVTVISSLVINLINLNCNGVYNVGTETKSIYDLAKQTRNVEPILKPTNVPDDTTMNLNKLKNIL
jgi:dTDP-4-dehydrorhamnose reductase